MFRKCRGNKKHDSNESHTEMERWSGRVAVVTGTSSGIGAAIAEELVKKGLKVVGLARRVERVEELAKSLKSEKGKLFPKKCDVTNEAEIQEVFNWVKSNLGTVDVLINNAAASQNISLLDGETEGWKTMLDLNIMGLSICTREALKIMKEKKIDDGHIIHINSVTGHVPAFEFYCMYSATKHAVTVLAEGLRKELVKQGSKIRVTSLSPGLVKTEMPPQDIYNVAPYLNPKDIADGVLFVLGTPPHVQIQELMIRPVGEQF